MSGQKNQCVITLVARELLEPQQISTAQAIMQDFGCEPLQSSQWLAPDRALDLFTNMPLNRADALSLAIRQSLANCDVAVQRAAGRRKALLAADMDATIVQGETLDDLAQHVGVGEQVAQITARAMRGELDFTDALIERLGLLKRLHKNNFIDFVQHCQFNPGAQTLIATMNKLGATTMLLTGGFDIIAQPLAKRLGFSLLHCNQMTFDAQGYVAGTIKLPLVDSLYKNEALIQQARSQGLSLSACLAIGDGANDIPMIKSAGLGIAYYGKPALLQATEFQIQHSDLTTALFFQGIAQDQFVQGSTEQGQSESH